MKTLVFSTLTTFIACSLALEPPAGGQNVANNIPPQRKQQQQQKDEILFPPSRPAFVNRTFHSPSVDAYIEELVPHFIDQDLATIFSNTLPNTLDTTVYRHIPDEDTFIITGDITAMWLRDSTRQVNPYLRFIQEDVGLSKMFTGLVMRQARSVLADSFANAFQIDDSKEGDHATDTRTPKMTNATFEGKYELDSLVSFLRLSSEVYAEQMKKGQVKWLENAADRKTWGKAISKTLMTIILQQKSTDEMEAQENGPTYTFSRTVDHGSDTTYQQGMGSPSRRTGMSRSEFRPSDDSQMLPYYIPSNAFAVVELRKVAKLLVEVGKKFSKEVAIWGKLAESAEQLAEEIDKGIRDYGIFNSDNENDEFYAFECDGYGNKHFMDDANIPGLLSLSYMGYVNNDDAVFQETRRRILSKNKNPYYFVGTAGEGVGGPHCGYNKIWPMAIITRIMSSNDEAEIVQNLGWLKDSAKRTAFMHESFNVDDVQDFTRDWFAWCNSWFAEMIMHLIETRPHLILKQ